MENLTIGAVFNKLGKWFAVIDDILLTEDTTALVAAHEDDGFKKWFIFEYLDGKWIPTGSSTDPEAAKDQYLITVNYKLSK